MAQVDWSVGMQPGSVPGGATHYVWAQEQAPAQEQGGQDGQGGVPLTSLIGAALSVALIIGVGLWGYELAMRDVNGVPVVRALEGPMRVQPEDPGGMAAEHQGLAVNAVAAQGGAARPADTLTLAPQAAGLAREDRPADPSATTLLEAAPLPPAEIDEIESASNAAVLAALRIDDPAEAARALADALAEDVAPLSRPVAAVTAAPAPAPSSAPVVETDRIDASIPGVKRSPHPRRRPAVILAAAARAANMPAAAPLGAAPATVRELAPASLAVGTRLVQLGAYASPEVARAEWDKLAARFDEYMEGKARVIQQAHSGGKTFYRLRAHGFDNLSDARRFCAVLVAAKAACIPVVTR